MPVSHHVLWVDDEPHAIRALIKFLTLSDCRVDLVTNGIEGLKLARSGRYDVAILDLVMVGMSGMQVLEELRRNSIETPVIVLTGHGTLDSALQAGRLRAVEFRAKPIRGPDLVELIHAAATPAAATAPRARFASARASGAPPSFRVVLECLDEIERSTTRTADSGIMSMAASRDHVATLVARLVADPDLTFLEFVAGCNGMRLVGKSKESALPIAYVRACLEHAVRRQSCVMDRRASQVLSRLVAARPDSGFRFAEAAATELQMSPASLWRLLKTHLGLNFRQCRRAIRLRQVVLELAHTREQVAQIAYAAGYQDPSQLDHEFGRALGVSPTTYRARLGTSSVLQADSSPL